MRKYKQIEYKAGATLEIIKCIPYGLRKGHLREKAEKKTKEEIRAANVRQAARRLARKINANFKPGDYHITLTYREPVSNEEAEKRIQNFLDRMRDRFKRRGFSFKYILVTEYKNKRIHHHIIINHINDGKRTTIDHVREIWKGNGQQRFVPLYDSGEYQVLAEYFIKETEKTFRSEETPTAQRYTCSRNLIEPKPDIRNRKTKRGWEPDPKPRKGYYILPDSLYNGFDRLGFPYQRYVMVKINPQPSDWELPRKEKRWKRSTST